jgi:hypothetical protein
MVHQPGYRAPVADVWFELKEVGLYFGGCLLLCVAAMITAYLVYRISGDERLGVRVQVVGMLAALVVVAVFMWLRSDVPQKRAVEARRRSWATAGGGQPYSASNPGSWLFVANERLNVRQHPNRQAAIIFTLRKGQRVIARQERRNVLPWVWIETENRRTAGFVHTAYLRTLPNGVRQTHSARSAAAIVWLVVLGTLSWGGAVSAIASAVSAVAVRQGLNERAAVVAGVLTFLLTNGFVVRLANTTNPMAWMADLYLGGMLDMLCGALIGLLVNRVLDAGKRSAVAQIARPHASRER